MIDGKQALTIIALLIGGFAVPASIFTFASDRTSLDNRSDAGALNSTVSTAYSQTLSTQQDQSIISSIMTNPNYYYIFGVIAVISSVLIAVNAKMHNSQ